MEFTQQEVLAMLEESGRTNWNIRQMTKLRSEGLLPKLIPKKKPGTNEPLNVWNETDLDQIALVYDLLEEYEGSHEMASLVLWLEGYGFSLDLLRKKFRRPLEYYLRRLTQGETDPDEIAFAVSSIAIMIFNKFQFTPRLVAQRKKTNKQHINLMTQIALDILSDQEPDTNMLRLLFKEENDLAERPIEDNEFFEQMLYALEIVREIFALSHLIEAVRTTTPEQWEQARTDYLSFWDIFSVVDEHRPESLPESLVAYLKIIAAGWLITPLLSARYHGYGQLIDIALEKVDEFLADPEAQEQVLNWQMARRANKADVEDSEKPDLSIPE